MQWVFDFSMEESYHDGHNANVGQLTVSRYLTVAHYTHGFSSIEVTRAP